MYLLRKMLDNEHVYNRYLQLAKETGHERLSVLNSFTAVKTVATVRPVLYCWMKSLIPDCPPGYSSVLPTELGSLETVHKSLFLIVEIEYLDGNVGAEDGMTLRSVAVSNIEQKS